MTADLRDPAADPRDPAAALLDLVAAALAADHGPSAVRSVERAAADAASSYPAHVLTVRLTGGRRISLFLKDLSARRYDADLAARRDREVAVYRDLLATAGLGTARYYGSVADPAANRYWLLLEHVDGEPLRWQPYPMWRHAAVWLGRLHAFAARTGVLDRCRELAPIPAGAYLATAQAARACAAAYGATLAVRVDRALAGYPDLVTRLAAGPHTVVHGSYRPQNILVGTAPTTGHTGGVRVCPVDWETAALGPVVYDLAYLCDGFDEPRRQELVDAYRAAAAGGGFPVATGPAADRLLAGCDLHKNLKTLAKAVDREFPSDGVERLVGMVEAVAARIWPARGRAA